MTLERLTVGEIAIRSLAAVRVLERHGIDYCAVAGKTLADVCFAHKLDPDGLRLELANAHDVPEEPDWTTAPLRQLIRHLAVDEHTWFREELSLLHQRLELVVASHGHNHPALQHLPGVFWRLAQDLEVHMRHEEDEVFPAIERYLDAIERGSPLRGSPLSAFGGPLRMMELEHESSSTALRLFREFAQNYAVPPDACLRYKLLIDGMLALEDRLLRHMYLENNVLYPRAAALKASRASES